MLTEDCQWTRVCASRIPSPSSYPIYLMPIVKSNIILKSGKTLYVSRLKISSTLLGSTCVVSHSFQSSLFDYVALFALEECRSVSPIKNLHQSG